MPQATKGHVMDATLGVLKRRKSADPKADLAAVFAVQTALIAIVEELSDNQSLTRDHIVGRLYGLLALQGGYRVPSVAIEPIRQLISIVERDKSPPPGLQQHPSHY